MPIIISHINNYNSLTGLGNLNSLSVIISLNYNNYNIPISIKALRAEYKRSPYFRDIVKYIRTGYCSYVEKAQRLFKMLCEDYILMDGILFKIRYVK